MITFTEVSLLIAVWVMSILFYRSIKRIQELDAENDSLTLKNDVLTDEVNTLQMILHKETNKAEEERKTQLKLVRIGDSSVPMEERVSLYEELNHKQLASQFLSCWEMVDDMDEEKYFHFCKEEMLKKFW